MDREVIALRALEAKRCEAIAAGDGESLKALLSEDYVHVHMTGKVDDRDGHIAAVVARPRQPVRGELTIRIYDTVGVVTGDLDNHMGGAENLVSRAYCHGVAVKRDGDWKFVSMQLARRD